MHPAWSRKPPESFRGFVGTPISRMNHFNTSDVHLESGGPLEIGKVAEILLNLMLKFGADDGEYKNLVLHRDGKYDLSGEQIAQIDRALRKSALHK